MIPELISPAEAAFNRRRQTFGLVVGPILTPHVGITTDANYAVYYREAAENVAAWLAGAPIRVVDGRRPTTGAWS